MTDKPGFSTIGGSATLLDDETQTKSPADKTYPLLADKDMKAILAKEVTKLESAIEQAEKMAQRARDDDDEKKYNQQMAAAENMSRILANAKEVRVRIEGAFCTFVLGPMREGINMATSPKDVVACLNRLISNYSNLKALEDRRRLNPKGSKLDYSGMGQIIRGKGEAA
jgi:hypothetical protein